MNNKNGKQSFFLFKEICRLKETDQKNVSIRTTSGEKGKELQDIIERYYVTIFPFDQEIVPIFTMMRTGKIEITFITLIIL